MKKEIKDMFLKFRGMWIGLAIYYVVVCIAEKSRWFVLLCVISYAVFFGIFLCAERSLEKR